MHALSRRRLLQSAGAAGAVAGSGIAGTLGQFAARAADTSGYKALVCLFLYGGADNSDMVLPYDQPSYDDYTAVRADLLTQYAAANSRARSDLLALNPTNGADFDGRAFALPPNFAGLHNLFETGKMSIVANVGPLVEKIDRDTYFAEPMLRPRKIFSHNDQQSLWQTFGLEGENPGWGGLFADRAVGSGANLLPAYTAIAMSANDQFLGGQQVRQYIVTPSGANTLDVLDNPAAILGPNPPVDAVALLQAHFEGSGESMTSLFEADAADAASFAINTNGAYTQAFQGAGTLATAFPATGLGNNLQAIATAINARNALGAARQVFFVGLGGFDTHDNQAARLPALQSEIDAAVVAFHEATVEMGLENDVTLFTAADFGRTFGPNDDGTDHGWGAHHFVVGGGVDGQRIFGEIPPYTLEHSQAAQRGILIPTLAVEEYAGALGRWFGLTDAELAGVLPEMNRFGGPLPLFA